LVEGLKGVAFKNLWDWFWTIKFTIDLDFECANWKLSSYEIVKKLINNVTELY